MNNVEDPVLGVRVHLVGSTLDEEGARGGLTMTMHRCQQFESGQLTHERLKMLRGMETICAGLTFNQHYGS